MTQERIIREIAGRAPLTAGARPVFRFAPSPNGRLHLGHAYSALLNEKLARETGGRLLLRIENTDTVRCTPVLEARMLEDLAWLGLAFDDEIRRQSEHGAAYRQALAGLEEKGLVYPGFLSRKQIADHVEHRTGGGESWPVDPDGVPLYPCVDRERGHQERQDLLQRNTPHTLRLDMAAALKACAVEGSVDLSWSEAGEGPDGESGRIGAEPQRWGDFMLFGKDRSAAYHLACVVDDAQQGVSHVVRGRDLFHATAAHRLLQELLGYPQPVYVHHELVLDADGRKLSKSQRDTSLADLRASGMTADDVRRRLGFDPA